MNYHLRWEWEFPNEYSHLKSVFEHFTFMLTLHVFRKVWCLLGFIYLPRWSITWGGNENSQMSSPTWNRDFYQISTCPHKNVIIRCIYKLTFKNWKFFFKTRHDDRAIWTPRLTIKKNSQPWPVVAIRGATARLSHAIIIATNSTVSWSGSSL